MEIVRLDKRTLSLKFPRRYKSFFERGSKFILSESGDTLLLKQIQEKPLPAEMDHGVKPMSLEEIDEVVHEVRHSRSGKR